MIRPAKVINLNARRPKSFTTNERFIEELRALLFRSGRTWKDIAAECSLSHSTVQRLARGDTIWPRHTTLFSVLASLNKRIAIVDARSLENEEGGDNNS